MHTTVASTCHHPISTLSTFPTHPPGHSTTLSPTIPLCPSCADIQELQDLLAYCQHGWDEIKASEPPDAASKTVWDAWRERYKAARGVYVRCCCAVANAVAQVEERDDLLLPTVDVLGCPVVAARDAEGDDKRRCERKGRRVRFTTDQEHMPEAWYRSPEEYERESPWYKPGRWADSTGQGFENTSDPPADERAWRPLKLAVSKFWGEASEKDSSGDGEGEGDDDDPRRYASRSDISDSTARLDGGPAASVEKVWREAEEENQDWDWECAGDAKDEDEDEDENAESKHHGEQSAAPQSL